MTGFPFHPLSWTVGKSDSSGGNKNCVYGVSRSSSPVRLGDIDCDWRLCPLCQVEVGTVFQFSGVCQEEDVDILYILEERTFTGYGTSSLFYSPEQRRWELHNLGLNNTLVAVKAGSAEPPVGAGRWRFSNMSCNDGGGDNYRTLNLHLAVEETGKYCCQSGRCIDSSLVCDGVAHCEGGEEELDCAIIQDLDAAYRRDQAPVDNKVFQPLQINTSLTLIEFVNIDDSNGLFSIIFR